MILTFLFFVSHLTIQSISLSHTSPTRTGPSVLLPLTFNILNKGQSIKIPLNTYFPFANEFTAYDTDHAGNLTQKLDVHFNLSRIQFQEEQEMVADVDKGSEVNSGTELDTVTELDNGTKIYLNQSKIYDVKTIYNQPNKLFLLQNNLIMMYSYREKSQPSKPSPFNKSSPFHKSSPFEQYLKAKNITFSQPFPKITLLNITKVAKLPTIKNSNLTCTQMEALPFQDGYKLIVLCKFIIPAPPQLRNYIVGLNMEQDNRGFIINLSFNDSSSIEYLTPSTSAYNTSKLFRILFQNRLQKQFTPKINLINILQRYLNQDSYLGSEQESSQGVPTFCKQFHLKYFQKLYIAPRDKYNHTVVAYCNDSSNPNQNRALYQTTFSKRGLSIQQLIHKLDANINNCLLGSKYIAEYENGFLSAIYEEIFFKAYLRFFKYEARVNDRGQTQVLCQHHNTVSLLGYLFITSRNQSGVQTVYVIFPDKIYIFESYSPNYQTLNITYEGLVLKSYAISNQMLFLHFQDILSTKYTIMAYDIKSMYPHLIDRVEFPLNSKTDFPLSSKTDLYFFSVMNYLQSGNYFFIYQRQTNLIKLTFYQGQYVNISVKNPFTAVGYQNLSIVNCSEQDIDECIKKPQTRILPIQMKIRAFCDSSIQIVSLQTIKLNSKLFNIDLVKAVLGPLGRFYKMNNPSTSLQFVNSFHQIEISGILNHFNGKKLITFSIDTFLNDPILTFYFEDFLVLKCDLEFDFYLMRPLITRCVQVITESDQNPEEIIIYEQGRFLQFIQSKIQFCRISSSRDVICIAADNQSLPIKKIKLIEYRQLSEEEDFISVFIIFERSFKQKDYIVKTNATSQRDVQISVNLVITQSEIEYLKSMTIRTVEYDEGYRNFLVVYMMDYFNPVNHQLNETPPFNLSQASLNETFFHIVQIYSKPQLQRGQSSNFVGHLIQQFTSTQGQQLQNIFIISNKIIILSNQPSGSTIQQFVIQDFKCDKRRNYPLYDHRITKNGSHSINSGFLFVEVQENDVEKFLVYNPALNTTNIITHSFPKLQNQGLLFIQKISPSDNVMAIHGPKLLTLSLPNIVVKLNQGSKDHQTQMKASMPTPKTNLQLSAQPNQQLSTEANPQLLTETNPQLSAVDKTSILQQSALKMSASLDVSFIDNNDILKVISFSYQIDNSDFKIDYSAGLDNSSVFRTVSCWHQIQIDPSQIIGPVSQYSIENLTELYDTDPDPAKDLCQFVKVNASDIFTKTKCIKYIDSKADGIMQDFLTYQPEPYRDITIIVTDIKILCIQNMKVNYILAKNKTKECNIFQSQGNIFLVCVESNSTTINRLEMKEDCSFERIWLPKPDVLKYNIFRMVITQDKAIFEVPIRSEQNKVYYVTNFYANKSFEDSVMLLKHQSQEEFISKDFTTNGTFMFLLENGLGIYNLSKANIEPLKITPDTWLSEEVLMAKFGVQEELTYVNCLKFDMQQQQIILEIGATFQSFQLQLNYRYNKSSNSIYFLDSDINVHYTYKNPWSCYNTLLSKSRYYQDMTIKMCSYTPDEHYIFSNFIPISENKQNSYIVFYKKNYQLNHSYPFRMDIIYTNIYSNDNFQIPIHRPKLLIGSLFNLLCQYELRDTFKFKFSINPNLADFIQDNQNYIQLQKKCNFTLILSNQNTHQSYPFTIKLDFQNKNLQFWTDWTHYIQRLICLLIVANYIRLQYAKRAEKARLSKLKIKVGRSNSFDQEFDLHVRLNSKKSL